MNIVQITPGAGGMHCGNCFRDNALVTALRRAGHAAFMAPLYLPLTLDETDTSAGAPIFFSGINVFLEQKAAFFRSAPEWLHRLLASPTLLRAVGGRAARTRPEQLGDLTISMLRGEEGHQARELEELIVWLRTQTRPDALCLSNGLLIGMVRRLKRELAVPVVGMLQGEESFLDALPVRQRTDAWQTLATRAREADLLVAPSTYYAERMARRLDLPSDRIRVVPNGISLDGYQRHGERARDPQSQKSPALGFFARMCREKGLDALVEAFILLKQRGRVRNLKLRVGGSCGPSDEPLVASLRARLQALGLLGEVEFHPNLDRPAKLDFLKSLTVFSVPALYGEAFGLYLLEALAAGVPVVQPRHAAFPELIEATGGGVLYEPGTPAALAEAIEPLFLEPARAEALGRAGQTVVAQQFSAERMAQGMLEAFALAKLRHDAARTPQVPLSQQPATLKPALG